MLKEENIAYLLRSFQMILSVPTTRSTFRLLQNAILGVTQGDQQLAQKLLESMLKGELKPGLAEGKTQEALKQVIAAFNVPVTVAKDIFERGDFINIITSDLIAQSEHTLFSNYIRRVDGIEFHFLSDVESTIQLLHHFAQRVKELKKSKQYPKNLENYRKHITDVRAQLKEVLQDLKAD